MLIHCRLKLLWFSLTVSLLFVAQTPSCSYAKALLLATANTAGSYYPVGVAISTLLSSKLAENEGLVVTAINTTGSGENIHLLAEGKCDLALVSGLHAVQAYRGLGFYVGRPMKNIAAISMLWNNVEHYAVRNDYVKKGDLSDLTELSGNFSIAMLDSGTIGSAQVILEALEIINEKGFDLEYLGYAPSVEAMVDKRIVGAAFTAGLPIAAVSQLFAAAGDRVTLLNVTDTQLEKINSNYNLWTRYTIKAGTYRGQNSDVQTIAYPNILVASDRLTEGEVYIITKTIFENLSWLTEIYSPLSQMTLKNALDGVQLPIHPGAAQYYREAGVKNPEILQ